MMTLTVSRIIRLVSSRVLSVIISCLLIVQAVHAVEDKALPAKTLPEPPVGAGQLANITLGLMIVLGLIFSLAWLYRRYGNISSFNRSNIQVLGGVSLGTREKAILLEVEGEKILVGVTPSQVTRLHVLEGGKRTDAGSRISDGIELQADNIEDFASKLHQEKSRSSGEKA
jgi:flagellar biosynthetic protein FliO